MPDLVGMSAVRPALASAPSASW